MYCPQCGKAYPEKINFCSHCGAAMFIPGATHKKLARSRHDKKIAGVCGGFAEYLNMDPTLVRLIWVMLALLAGWGLIGYLLAWIIMSEESAVEPSPTTVPAIAPHPAPNH